MKNKNYLFLALLTFGLGHSQTLLSEGDVAITGVNADNPDQFAFVLLTDVLSGTEVHFTDKGWLSTGGWRLNNAGNTNPEGIVTWTALSDLSCGSEIIITDTGSNTYSATTGNAIESEGGFALASAGDQLIAYQGSLASPNFIFAVHFANGNGWTNATDNNNSAVPAGLTEGVNAIDLGNSDNSNYLCTVTSNQELILAAIATVDATNWYQTNNNAANRPVLGGCTYTCVASGSCASTVTWDGSSWVGGLPDLTTEVIIDGAYDTATDGSFSACSLMVNSGVTLTVDNGYYIEVENDVEVSGVISVQTRGNFVQNNSAGTFTLNGSGTASVFKLTATKQDWYYYTYWSSPVTNETIEDAFPNTNADRRFWFSASNFLDTDGDNIDDNGDDWRIASGTDAMTPGTGYAATSGQFGLYPGADSATFEGEFNTGNISTSIVYNAANASGSWNFIGNPYPSAIDFVAFQAANSNVIDGAAYFWSQFTPPDKTNPGNELINFSQNDYATYTVGTGGAAGASGIIPDRYVPSGQGFFVSGVASGTATFTNSMRMADGTSNTQFFKNSFVKKTTSDIENKLWINLTSDNGVFNQVLVGYVNGATNGDDGLYYDAPKLISGDAAILYTKMSNSDKSFVIQGKTESSLNENEVINLGFNTNINIATLYKLSIARVQGDFLTNNPIYLKDNFLNKVHDLSDSDYTFTSEVGEFNDRFEVVFNNVSLSTNEAVFNENNLRIIELDNDEVQFSISEALKIKSIRIYDLLGRNLYNFKTDSSKEVFRLSNLNGSYIAKVELSNGQIITKKAIKK